MSDQLQEIINRVKVGSCDETDIQAIAAAMQSGTIVLATGDGSIGVGGNMTGSQAISGSHNILGNSNTVIHFHIADPQILQAILAIVQELQTAAQAVSAMQDAEANLMVGQHSLSQVIQTRLQPTPALFSKGLCKGQILSAKPDRYFVSHGFTPDLLADWRQALVAGLAQASGDSSSLEPYFAGDTLASGFRLCGICDRLFTSRFSMFLLPPSQDRNVYLELGIAIGLGAPFFLIQHHQAQIPAVLAGLSRYVKGGLFRAMQREIAGQIEEYDFGVVHFVANLPQAGSQFKYLIAGGESIEDEDFEGSIKDTVENNYPQLEMISLSNQLAGAANSGWVLNHLVESIQSSRLAIYRVDEESSPSTFLALGISLEFGLKRKKAVIAEQRLP